MSVKIEDLTIYLSMDRVMDEYPMNCLPNKLKRRTNKAKHCAFEEIDDCAFEEIDDLCRTCSKTKTVFLTTRLSYYLSLCFKIHVLNFNYFSFIIRV